LGSLILIGGLFQVALLLGGIPLAGRLAGWTGVSPWGTLATATALFGPPSLFLATVSPFAIRLAARNLERVGATAGRLFALSTGGSLFGTLLCTFALIPYLDLRRIFALLILATAIAAAATLEPRARGSRLNLAGLALLAATTTFGLMAPQRVARDTLYQRITPYQTLEVLERDGRRTLRSDGISHSAIDLATGGPALAYLRFSAAGLLLAPEMERMLVLGMGGGSVGRYLGEQLPELSVDYVEIDPAIPEIARRFFLFEDDATARVHVADGRSFLAASPEQWDYIYCDTYIGLSVPFHLTTREFFAIVADRLAPGGVLGINLAASLQAPFSRAILRTVADRFPSVYAFSVGSTENYLILASADPERVGAELLARRALTLDRRWTFHPTLEALASRRVELSIEPERDLLLTDEYAPADHLIRLGQPRLPVSSGR
jgi:spermidine synthase